VQITGAVTTSVPCDNFSWEAILDFSAVPDGPVTISVELPGDVPVTRQLVKETAFCASNPSEGDFAGGDGLTPETAYRICTVEQFDALRRYGLEGTHYVLMNNLDLSSGFSGPIGEEDGGACGQGRFCGNFDGNGFHVANPVLIHPDRARVGVFAAVSQGSVVDFGVEEAQVTGRTATGTLIGSTWGGSYRDLYSTGDVLSVYDDFHEVHTGGLVGSTNAHIERCFSLANVTGTRRMIGGLVGSFHGILLESHAHGHVMSAERIKGGLVGVAGKGGGYDPSILRSFATGNVVGQGSDTGGFVGQINYNLFVEDCYATGSVISHQGSKAGFLGSAQSWGNTTESINLRTSYASGHVISGDVVFQPTAGFAAYLGEFNVLLQSLFAVGQVRSGGNLGGFAGHLDASDGSGTLIVDATYWNHPGNPDVCIGTDSSPGDVDECTAETDFSLFTDPLSPVFDAWDFDAVWEIRATGELPRLMWE
jgi:hypothetical protein